MSDRHRSDPEPAALEAPVELRDVEQRRAVHCPEYDGCLDLAVRRRWTSWTCQRCPLFAVAVAPRAADVFFGPQALPA
jgi:hypothetical protein